MTDATEFGHSDWIFEQLRTNRIGVNARVTVFGDLLGFLKTLKIKT